MARGDGEQEFVVLAIAKCLLAGAAAGGGDFAEFEAAAAGLGEAREVFREAVGQVHHRGRPQVADQPGGFGEARREREVLAGDGAPEAAGDEHDVTGFSAGAEGQVRALDEAFAGDGNHRAGGQAAGLTARQHAAVGGQAFPDPAVEAVHPGDRAIGIDRHRDQQVLRFSAHCGEVAQHAGDGLPADFRRGGLRQEMHAFDQRVGLQKAERTAAGVDHRAVVTGADDQRFPAGETAQDAGDEGVFAEVA